jgi:hypothetical protein
MQVGFQRRCLTDYKPKSIILWAMIFPLMFRGSATRGEHRGNRLGAGFGAQPNMAGFEGAAISRPAAL